MSPGILFTIYYKMQVPIFDLESDWQAPRLADLPSWEGAKRIAVDVETKDPDLTTLGPGVRRGGHIIGIAFAIEDHNAFYLPVRHEGGDNMIEGPDKVFEYLRNEAKRFRGDLIGANLPYDLDFLAEEGIIYTPRWFRDVQVAEPLIDDLQLKYKLDEILKRHGLPGKDEEHLKRAAQAWGLKDVKAELYKLPARHVGAYAIGDVVRPLQLLRRQETIIDDQNLWEVYNLESRLLPVLLKMRRRGVRIDFDRLAQVADWALAEETKALKEITRLTGISLTPSDTTKANALEPALIKIGVTVPRTPKNDLPSITNDILKTIDHDVARMILRAKKFNKLRTTFVASIQRHATNGRVHSTFNQLRREKPGQEDKEQGVRYGRLSSTNPNLQQQPARDKEIAPVWRAIYLPDEGAEFVSLDYSQQEPRWLTHYAELLKCTGAKRAAERYRKYPDTDNHKMMAELTGIDRDDAKQIYLALCYGMGGAKLCHKLGLPTKWVFSYKAGKQVEVAGEEGQALLYTFNTKAPFIKEFAIICQDVAKRKGYIKTVGNRRCRFPKKENGKYDWTHIAINRVIQGSSGDQIKKAMVEADEAGYYLQLQVHDELANSAWRREEIDGLGEIMLNTLSCNVPHKIDKAVGPSWGEVKKLERKAA